MMDILPGAMPLMGDVRQSGPGLDNHLTTTYTTWLSPLLGYQLDQTIRTSRRRRSGEPGDAQGHQSTMSRHDAGP
jgi:hypothetical protein